MKRISLAHFVLSRLVMDSHPDIMDSIISYLSVFSFLRSKKPRRTKNKMNKMKQYARMMKMEDRWKKIKMMAIEDTRKKELKKITGMYFTRFFPPASCLISRKFVVCSKLILSPDVIIENICFQSAESVNSVMYIWRQSCGVASREHSPLEQIFFWF